MVRGPTTSLEKRASIIALHNEGFTIRYIANKLKLPRSTVGDAITRFRKTGSNQDRKRSGRPRVTSKPEDQSLIIMSKMNRKLTAPEIQMRFNESHDRQISLSTVKERLQKAGLNGRVSIKKPLLRRGNKKKRLEWAHAHKNWTVDDWKQVLWTDESKFEMFGQKRRVYVRRGPSEKMHPDAITPTVKHAGGSVMVWGCFSYAGVGDLHRIKGTLDQKGYHSILKMHAIPSGMRLIGRGFLFQQDNDPKHTSKLCATYLKNKEDRGELKIMKWPPQSPDLNPIELLWDELDRQIRKLNPTSFDDLWEALQTSWNEIPSHVLEKLIKRMPRLVKKVLSVKGGFFDEKKV